MKYNSMKDLIGNTPLVKINVLTKDSGSVANVYAKVEAFNPSGSVKDRAALGMLSQAQKEGIVTDKTVIVEPTSGNTGIGLAALGAAMGLRVILTMPDTMTLERRTLLKAYGAELVLTDGAFGMKGAISKANELAAEIENSFIPSQFENYSNAQMHYETTGPEIYKDLEGDVDVFVAGIGTGGTITGTGKYLKEKNPNVKIVAVEPSGSAILSGNKPGPHKIQGIGAGFVPGILDTSIYSEVIAVSNEDAFDTARKLAKQEGILAGISSGAALHAALELAKRSEYAGKNIVVILPDSGDRYLSSKLYLEA